MELEDYLPAEVKELSVEELHQENAREVVAAMLASDIAT